MDTILTGAKNTLFKLLPGLKAGFESFQQKSTTPYKQFISETNKKIVESPIDTALGLTGGEAPNIAKRFIKETSVGTITNLLKKNFSFAKSAIDDVAPKLAKSNVLSEIEGLLAQAKTIPKTAAEKLIDAIKSAKPQRTEIAVEQTAARAKRAIEAQAASAGKEGRSAFYTELGKLKGELTPTKSTMGSLEGEGEKLLNENDVTGLFNMIRGKGMSFYDKLSAQNGLERLLGGEVPPPSQLSLLEDVFGSDLIQVLKDKRPLSTKIGEVVMDIIADVPRALKTTMDLSATLRQGIKTVIRHPIKGKEAFVESVKNVFSETRFNKQLDTMKAAGEYQTAKDSGLFIADPRKLVGAHEELFTSNLVEKIPIVKYIVKASNRAYVSFLNKLRFDVFNDLAKTMPKNEYKSLAEFINTATGRGGLGKLAQSATALSKVFFAPRYVSSQLSFLNPFWYAKQTPSVRKEAAKTMATYVGTITSMMTLAKLGGADVETDWRSSNFGKMAIPSDSSVNSVIKAAIPSFLGVGTQTFNGKTHYDLTFGTGQYIRLVGQLVTGERKTQSGSIEKLSADKPFSQSRLGVLEAVIRGKLAPLLSTMADVLHGKNVVGEDVTAKSALIDNLIPLYVNDIVDIMQQPSPDSVFGTGGQTTLPTLPKLPQLPKLPKLPKIQGVKS